VRDRMRAIVFGATGMIGSGVVIECLRDPDVTSVLAVVRASTGRMQSGYTELVHADFSDYSTVTEQLTDRDACFFCLGVSAVGLNEAAYEHITLDLTLAAAESILAINPELTFCYVSGAGTDGTERGRQMWARVKGRTENRLLALSPRTYMFRPGFIQPVRGVRSKTGLYRAVYAIAGPIYPLLKRVFPRQVMTSEDLGRAMIRVARTGNRNRVLEPADIIEIAGRGPATDE
jgi:uncharacterized protein YbjT (DUF2867 family)